jgi:hypothetical protein
LSDENEFPGENKIFIFPALNTPDVSLPPKNQSKEFKKANKKAMEELDNAMKIAVLIYKCNMTKTHATLSMLTDYFEGLIKKDEISYSLDTLGDWGIITSGYTEVEKDRLRRAYRIDGDNVQRIRQVYEEHVRPNEKPEEQIDFVDGIILEK